MILLEKENYYKLIEPLKKVKINTFFARSVIEKSISGIVYVDNKENPTTFYIVHPYGMSLLFGNCNNKDFNNNFKNYALNIHKERNSFQWMQTFPNKWNSVLNELFNDSIIKFENNINHTETGIVELNSRINFKFNLQKFLDQKEENTDTDIQIVRTDKEIFRNMKGSVIPYYFWKNENTFLENGIGFSLFYKNKLASTAYSAFVQVDKLEIGIETIKEFRGKGFAQKSCVALIHYCLKNNYEPIWACRLENIGSYKLAQKLGFEPTLQLPYYRLSN